MNRTRISLSVLFTFTVLVATSHAQTSLRWKLSPGQNLRQTTTQKMTSSAEVAGQKINTTMTQTTEALWSVGQVDNQGIADVRLTMSRIQMKMTGFGGINIEIDSASDEEPAGFAAAFAGPLKAMAKASFDLKMNSIGEILEAKASEETLQALKNLPSTAQTGGVLTEEGLVNMIRQGAPVLAMAPVRPGDSWERDLQLALPQIGKLDTKTEMTYAGPVTVDGKQLEKIDLNLHTDMKPGDANAQVKMQVKQQTAKGSMYFDNVSGRLSHSDLKQQMTMQIEAAGRSFEQSLIQDIRVTLIPME